jgi:hypothetical protein
MATNVELRRSNGTDYNEVIHFKTSVAMVEGLLDENDKINASLLPSFVLGGLRFLGVFPNIEHTQQFELSDLNSWLDTYIANNGGSKRGCYFINPIDSVNIFAYEGTGYSIIGGEENWFHEHGELEVVLERGDWLICVSEDGKTWSIINNTYQDATTSLKGIVQLATEQDGIDGTSSVKAMTPKSTVAAINARAYQHPTYTAKDETFSAVETLSALSVNSLGHVTSFAKQAIRVASESQTGVIQLASSSEAKAATDDTKATSPLRVKEMIDKFASIELVQSLPTDMSDHPAGKLILLQI